ncbi:unnamed protein product [Peniophora sp. CBMAI 1063]|nr:unnamed protein product [Peniophora sp. CBMAI 1063]
MSTSASPSPTIMERPQERLDEKDVEKAAPSMPAPQAAPAPSPATESTAPGQTRKFDFWFLPIPKRLRYEPERKVHFGLLLNSIFGFASTFIVANLYYCQPILIELAAYFNVDYDRIARVPTLVQGGYGCGLLLIAPLGDLVPRRPLLLGTIFIAFSLTIGLATTKSLVAFEVITFFVGMASVAPQILIPLAADLAPPERRASAMALVLGGLLFGVLLARVLAGIIAQFSSWRNVYYMALGAQVAVFGALWSTLPDYPSKNPHLTYVRIMGSMVKLAVTEPRLIQACIVSLASSVVFTCYWISLTFVLGDPPYSYSTLVIGLFGLIGAVGVMLSPLVGRLVDKMIPWYSALFATIMLMLVMAIYWGAAGLNVAAVVVTTIGLDVFRQLQQVSLTTSVVSISAPMRARLNSILILALFVGQVTGSAVSAEIYTRYGWRAIGAFMFALCAFQIPLLLVRGPHTQRYTWFGYQGGLEFRKSVVAAREKERVEHAEVERASGAAADSKQPLPEETAAQTQTAADEKRDDPSTSV